MKNIEISYQFGDWLVEPHLNRISKHELVQQLEPRTMDVLECLLDRSGEVVGISELLDIVWPGRHVEPHMVAKRVSQIRKALSDDAKKPAYIATVSKRGYRTLAAVASLEPPRQGLLAGAGGRKATISLRADDASEIVSIDKPKLSDTAFSDISTGHYTAEAARQVAQPRQRRFALLSKAFVSLVGFLALIVVVGVVVFQQRSSTSNSMRSIAVLPLENFSGKPSQQYVADGMTEEIIAELSKLKQLQVVSRTSVMRYGEDRPPIQRIAQDLGVNTIIEGSIAMEGDRFRVTIQLIDAIHDRHIWAQSFDHDTSSVLALRSNIARQVALKMELGLSDAELSAFNTSRHTDALAYDAYLRAIAHIGASEYFPSWAPLAIKELERAVAIDSNFAEAWAQLALIETIKAVWVARENFVVVREYTERALSIDSRLAMAHTALGYIHMLDDWDIEGADKAFKRALELSPNDSRALQGYVNILRVQDRSAEAIDVARRLLASNPNDLTQRAESTRYLYGARLYDRVIAEADSIRLIDPDFYTSDEAAAYYRLGRFKDSHRARVAAYSRCGNACSAALAAINSGWEQGGYEGAMSELAKHRFQENERGPYWFYAQLGNSDAAFEDVERLMAARSPWMIGIRYHPSFDLMRLDSRFDKLQAKIGLSSLSENPVRMADIGRLMSFRGMSEYGAKYLAYAMTAQPNDPRFAYWLESMAWAKFAAAEYSQAIVWARQALEHDISPHARALAYLLLSSSYANLDQLEASTEALHNAQASWPDTLSQEDLLPFFLGGDTDMRDRYIHGLRLAGFEA